MGSAKRFFKRNTHNSLFKALAGFGRSLNRLYENRNHDIYSNGELTILEKLATLESKVIIDGGANIGGYSTHASRLMSDAQIYAFEPVKSTYDNLIQNTSSFQNVEAIHNGLYLEKCSKEINIFPSHTHSSIYDIEGLSYESHSKETISLINGDEFLNEYNIEEVDLLKIDVEGAEYDALLGFEESLNNRRIRAIQFEYGYINITTKKLLVDYHNFFESKGYVLGKIFPKTVEFRKYEFKHEDFIGPNFIAVREDDDELIDLLSNK